MDDLLKAGAVELGRLLREGAVSAEAVTRACLARIEAEEERVGAWAFLDPAHALAQARALDRARAAGEPPGSLFGLPVGVKDIVDTFDMPTESGTPLLAGRQPEKDATLVARLRAEGAVILGKTVTTELAAFTPGRTRNPRDGARTPGGSSSGSAAAVAAGMVPLAIGSQTSGSVIRPAAYCGVVGYKPSHGLIPRTGVLAHAAALDTMGVMAGTVAGAALLVEALAGHCPGDLDTSPRARPPLLAAALAEPPAAPRLAFVRQPVWGEAEPGLQAAFLAFAARHGLEELALPPEFDQAHEEHRRIAESGIAWRFAPLEAREPQGLSPRLRAMMESGRRVSAVELLAAQAFRQALRGAFARLMQELEAIVTPATAGTAPLGLESTGNPNFCTIWTLIGAPAVTLPLLEGDDGMPIGVQLVGAPGDDARLLRTARWLERAV